MLLPGRTSGFQSHYKYDGTWEIGERECLVCTSLPCQKRKKKILLTKGRCGGNGKHRDSCECFLQTYFTTYAKQGPVIQVVGCTEAEAQVDCPSSIPHSDL